MKPGDFLIGQGQIIRRMPAETKGGVIEGISQDLSILPEEVKYRHA